MLSFFKKLFGKTIPFNPLWNDIVVGKIIKVERHPNADRLNVCTVDCGDETRTIVCGGVNVKDNMLVAVARPGVKVRLGGEPNLTELKETTIRGVLSEGMLCGADEIELTDRFPITQEKEIVDLSNLNNIIPGKSLSQALK